MYFNIKYSFHLKKTNILKIVQVNEKTIPQINFQ